MGGCVFLTFPSNHCQNQHVKTPEWLMLNIWGKEDMRQIWSCSVCKTRQEPMKHSKNIRELLHSESESKRLSVGTWYQLFVVFFSQTNISLLSWLPIQTQTALIPVFLLGPWYTSTWTYRDYNLLFLSSLHYQLFQTIYKLILLLSLFVSSCSLDM